MSNGKRQGGKEGAALNDALRNAEKALLEARAQLEGKDEVTSYFISMSLTSLRDYASSNAVHLRDN